MWTTGLTSPWPRVSSSVVGRTPRRPRTWWSEAPSRPPTEPGHFYRRELPHLLRVLAGVQEPLEAIIVDGYVWLGADKPGLGAHLYEALCRAVPVIGVAKTPYVTTGPALPIVRGQSLRPLLITAIGMETATAAEHIRRMHGASRMPYLLTQVDRLSRAP